MHDDAISPLLAATFTLSRCHYVDTLNYHPKHQKPLRKCNLKGCNKMHSHNGGACCPEHHKMWMNQTKEVSQ